MRYTLIDGLFIEVKRCSECPFYSTEYESGATCRYPQNSAKTHLDGTYLGRDAGVSPDCPLAFRTDEGSTKGAKVQGFNNDCIFLYEGHCKNPSANNKVCLWTSIETAPYWANGLCNNGIHRLNGGSK